MSSGIISSNIALIEGGGINNQGGNTPAANNAIVQIGGGIIYGIDAPEELMNIAVGGGFSMMTLSGTTNVTNVVALSAAHVASGTTTSFAGEQNSTIDVLNASFVSVSITGFPTKYNAVAQAANSARIDVWVILDGGYYNIGNYALPTSRNVAFNFPVTPGEWEFEIDVYTNQAAYNSPTTDPIAIYYVSKDLVRGANTIPYVDMEDLLGGSPIMAPRMNRTERQIVNQGTPLINKVMVNLVEPLIVKESVSIRSIESVQRKVLR